MNIAVLVSGGGTNLQALIDYERSHADCPYRIVLVVSNTKNAYALERAKNAGIPAQVRSPFSVLGADKAKEADRDTKRIAISDAVLKLCKEPDGGGEENNQVTNIPPVFEGNLYRGEVLRLGDLEPGKYTLEGTARKKRVVTLIGL